MGGFAGVEQLRPWAAAVLAGLVALLALYILAATRQVRHQEALPGRRKQYRKIAACSFISAPLAFVMCLLSSMVLFQSPVSPFIVLGFALFSVFMLLGLVNLSRAHDVRKQERFYSGEDQKRA